MKELGQALTVVVMIIFMLSVCKGPEGSDKSHLETWLEDTHKPECSDEKDS